MGRVVRFGRADQRPDPRQVRDAPPARAGARAAGRSARPAQHRLHQHDPARARALVPRRRARRAPDQGLHQVERRRDGVPRQPPGDGRGRAHRDLRQRGQPVRGRLQPLLPRQGPRRVRGSGVLPGTRGARHLRTRLPRGQADRGPAQRVPAGALASWRRTAVLPAPAADAGLLGVPHGVDGARRAQLDLPGQVQPVPAGPRDPRHLTLARMGVPRRRRDGRARGARRDRAGFPRGTGQPHLRHQLQPAAAGRPGARQRQDHPGARGVLPRRGLERDQGHLGPRLGPAARQGHRRRAGQQDEHHAGRPVPDLQRGVGRVHQGELLRQRSPAARHGGAPVRRRAARPVPRRARLPQGVRGVQGGPRAHRPAHGHPGAHDQGLDAGQGLRGPQRHAPDEEAHRGRAEGVQGPALPADPGFGPGGGAAAVLPPGRGLRRDPVHARAAGRPRRGAPPPGRPGQAAAYAQPTRSTTSCARARASRRWPPRWRSSGCSRS